MNDRLYWERKECLMCRGKEFEIFFDKEFTSSLSLVFREINGVNNMIPFNLLVCQSCQTVQTKYLGDLKKIYGNNHVDSFGLTKQRMIEAFSSFVSQNGKIEGIVEAGTPNADLAHAILEKSKTSYTIIEPDFQGDRTNMTIVSDFLENVDLNGLKANTLVLSHVFEHLYSPLDVLEKIKESSIQYIFFNHPNFEYYCKKNVYNILNIEHISYFEEGFLVDLLKKYGFQQVRREDYEGHSILLEFERCVADESIVPRNKTSVEDTKAYFKKMFQTIDYLNQEFHNTNKKVYLWPASAHNITLLNMGFNPSILTAFLDNSPSKIGKVLADYNIPCLSFQEILKSKDPENVLLIGCAGNYLKELDFGKNPPRLIFLEDIGCGKT